MSLGSTGYKGPAMLIQDYAGDKNVILSGRIIHSTDLTRTDFSDDYSLMFYVPVAGNLLGEDFANYELSPTIEILVRALVPSSNLNLNKWFAYSLTEIDHLLGFKVSDLGNVIIGGNSYKNIQIELRNLINWIPLDKVTMYEISNTDIILEISTRLEFAKIIV